jgi:hypothetical protein
MQENGNNDMHLANKGVVEPSGAKWILISEKGRN